MLVPQKAQIIIEQTLKSLQPDHVFQKMIQFTDDGIQIKNQIFEIKENIYIFAVGKAASYEASALKNLFESNDLSVKQCLAYTKLNHTVDDPEIYQLEGDHPFLTQRNIDNSKIFLEHLQKVPKNSAVFFLLSGGASALLELPVDELSLEQVQDKYKKLLESGKSISEVNLYRKAMSKTKNGGLLAYIQSKTIIQFITCDIPNENLADVGSGPLIYQTIPNEIFKNLNIEPKNQSYNKPVNSFLTNSASMLLKQFKGSSDIVLGRIYDTSVQGIIDDLMKELPEKGQMHISAGEGSIKLPEKHGKGGRNTHFVLAMAQRLYKDSKNRDLKIMSFGTDGTDGPTDAAGAFIDYEIYQNNNPKEYLKNFDSYNYFKKVNTLIYTGPTKTNIMDIRCVWRE